MSAYLTPQNHARVKIKVKTKKRWQTVDCLIDTGYSSGLALSELLMSDFNFQPVAEQEFELADGSAVLFAVYKIEIKFKNQKKKILGVFTKSRDNLVGLEFLDGLRLVLDLKKKNVSLS